MPDFGFEVPMGLSGDALIAAINDTLRRIVTEREPEFLSDVAFDEDSFQVTVVDGAQAEVNRLEVGERRPVLLVAKGIFRATGASSIATMRLLRADTLEELDRTILRLDTDAGSTARKLGYALVAVQRDPAPAYVVTAQGTSTTGGRIENQTLVAMRF